jgi:hypothetical protein
MAVAIPYHIRSSATDSIPINIYKCLEQEILILIKITKSDSNNKQR